MAWFSVLKEKRNKHTSRNNPTATWHTSLIPPPPPLPPILNRPLPVPHLPLAWLAPVPFPATVYMALPFLTPHSLLPAFEDGTDTWFRNVGILHTDPKEQIQQPAPVHRTTAIRTNWMSEWHEKHRDKNSWDNTVFCVQYELGLKKQLSIDCILCEERAEVEERLQNCARNATQSNEMAALRYVKLTLGLLY